MPRKRADTPIRLVPATYHTITQRRVKQTQEDILESSNHLIHLTETGPFIKKFFQERFTGNASEIFKSLKGSYNAKDKRWKGFPQDDSKEHLLYGPLVKLCNDITARTQRDKPVPATWVDYHTRSPQANYETQARTRPDCMNMTETIDLKKIMNEMEKLEKQKSKMRGEHVADAAGQLVCF